MFDKNGALLTCSKQNNKDIMMLSKILFVTTFVYVVKYACPFCYTEKSTMFARIPGHQSNAVEIRTLTSVFSTTQKTSTIDTEKDLSHWPEVVRKSLLTTGHNYYCPACAVGFSKQKNYHQHVDGRKHKLRVSEQASVWDEFSSEAPGWSIIDDSSNNTLDIQTGWREVEFATFPHRSSCIDPSLTLSTISPQLLARFWRYLRDSFGVHFPEFASIFHHVFLVSPRYLRVKELFESLEAFQIISNIIVMSSDSHENIDTIYDLACGHGLVGILLAYRFPTKHVICVDLEARGSFDVFRTAFETKGQRYQMRVPLDNLEYRTADLLTAQPELTSSSFLIALHACNEANKQVVDMANGAGAMWAVMPCCIRSKLYMNGASVLDLDSESRYKMLCGAFAQANGAQLVRAISRDITARPIIIAGGWFDSTTSSERENKAGNDHVQSLPNLCRRGTMPPLQ